MIELVLCASLACTSFAVGRWLGLRYEPGAAHYILALLMMCFAAYLVWAPIISLDLRWVSLSAGSYVGLSLGSFLRILWGEEREESEASVASFDAVG